jgi:O-acetyl-ADP-ribose deacetylase (regulator of RNase III)
MNQVLQEHILQNGGHLKIVEGDITQEQVDAIVNAANSHLDHGAGVAGAISRRGGPQIQAESYAWVQQHGRVSYAEPAYTHAGKLPCRYVIHAVGPVWGDGDEAVRLSAAIQGSLRLADRLELTSIALPAISTGIFGYPKKEAAEVILASILEYFADNPASGLQTIHLTLYDRQTIDAFSVAWKTKGLGQAAENKEYGPS